MNFLSGFVFFFAVSSSAIAAGFGPDLFSKSPVGTSSSPTSANPQPAKPIPPNANPATPQKLVSPPPIQAPVTPANQKK